MTEWFSAAALAGLPGMPSTAQNVNARAKREHWQRQRRTGRGGGWEYSVASLPEITRAHLAAQLFNAHRSQAADAGATEGRKLSLQGAVDATALQCKHEAGLAKVLQLRESGRTRMDAKLAIIAAVDQYTKSSRLSASKALQQFCALYNDGQLSVEDWVSDVIADVHPATIYRWRRTLRVEGVAALAGQYTERQRAHTIERQPDLREFAVAMLTDHPHVSAAHVMKAMRARFGGRTEVALPSMRGLQRWLANWKAENKQVFLAVRNPDAWKNSHMVAFGSYSEDIARLNQRWELDSTPGDLDLLDGRHSLVGVIDIYSRRLKLVVSRTSTAVAVAAAVRRAMLDWGVPEEVKTDNGKDYTSQHVQRVLRSLSIEQQLCTPFSGWEKPHIERALGTFNHDLVELLPNYIGHNVADRKELDARRSFADRLMKKGETLAINMTAQQLQTFADKWCDHIYHHQPHRGLGNRSPLDVAAGYRGEIRRIRDERALDVLLAEAPGNGGMRTVTKKGLRIDGFTYIAAELGEFVGEQVHIRYDETDIGRVYVFNEQGFICVAEDPAYTGISRREVAAHAREQQKAQVQAARRELKAGARRARTRDIADEILTANQVENNVTAFRPRGEDHMTAALHAAAQAVGERDALNTPATTTSSHEERAAHARFLAELAQEEARQAEVVELGDDPRRNYAYWRRLDTRAAAGARLTEQEKGFWARYPMSQEYTSMERLFEEFGLNAEDFA